MGQSCGGSSTDTTAGGVYFSDDLGETWVSKLFVSQSQNDVVTIAPANVTKLRVDPKNRSVVYITTTQNGVYKTFTAGEQWVQTGIATGLVRDLQIHPLNSEILYITYGTSILKSADAGSTWNVIYRDVAAGEPTRIAIDWFNPQRLIIGTTLGQVLISEDEGINWNVYADIEGPITDLIMSPADSRVLYITELDRSVHRSQDGGYSWENMLVRTLKPDETDNNRIAEQQNWDLFLSLNPGFTTVKGTIFDLNDPEKLYAVTAEGLYISTDRAKNWSRVDTLIAQGAEQNARMRAVTTVPGAPQLLFFAVGNKIHKSEDFGKTWKTIDDFVSSGIITTMVSETITTDDPESNSIFAGTENPPKPKRTFFQVVPTE
jgi:photosystem II stability/assembly factor-like uncharacterized protein